MVNEINIRSQNIAVELIDENYKRLRHCSVDFIGIMAALYEIKNYQKKYSWLSTIDLYGDTVFNRLQKKKLVEELENFLKEKVDTNLAKDIKEIVEFVKKSFNINHSYIKLVGD